MKSFFRLNLAIVALTLFFGALSVSETKAQGVLNEVLNRMDKHNKALTSLQTSVKMEKINAQLGETDVYEGTAKYLPQRGKDALVRIDWVKPAVESLAIVNKQYVIYRKRLDQAIVGNVNDAKSQGRGANNALSFINMSKAQLKANYTVVYLGQENVTGGIQTWHLQLTPKTKQSYETAELWVDGNGMPIQAKVIENNKDTTTVYLSNVEKNKTLNASVFMIDLSKVKNIQKS